MPFSAPGISCCYLNNMKKIIFNIFLLSMLAAPFFVAAQTTGLVPCGAQGGLPTCGVVHIFALIANIVKFLLFTVAVPLCALAITYGGIKIAMYSTNPGAKDEGKKIIINAAIGLLIALASYLIVDTIIKVFTEKDGGVDQLQRDLGGDGFVE